jgi:hypothetical protein
MTKFEVTDEMLGDAIRAYNRAYCTKDQVWDDAMRAAISAAFEASGLVERIAELEDQNARLRQCLGEADRYIGRTKSLLQDKEPTP